MSWRNAITQPPAVWWHFLRTLVHCNFHILVSTWKWTQYKERQRENVSAWRNNEGTHIKQSKITLTLLFITHTYSDIQCCCLSLLFHITTSKLSKMIYYPANYTHFCFTPSVSEYLKYYIFFFGLIELLVKIFISSSNTLDAFLKSSSNYFK